MWQQLLLVGFWASFFAVAMLVGAHASTHRRTLVQWEQRIITLVRRVSVVVLVLGVTLMVASFFIEYVRAASTQSLLLSCFPSLQMRLMQVSKPPCVALSPETEA